MSGLLLAANGSLGATLLDVTLEQTDPPAAVLVGPVRPGVPEPCPFTTAWCRRHRVEAIPAASWRDGTVLRALAGRRFGLLLSLAYDLILPPAALALADRAVNLHRGIAPDFKGCYSTAWALEHGASEVGVTLHEMTAEVDAGPILAQRRLTVRSEDTAAELTPLVEELAVRLLRQELGALLIGELVGKPQVGGSAYARRLPSHDFRGDSLAGLSQRVRSLHHPPHPPVTISLGRRRFGLVDLEPLPVLEQLTHGRPALAFSGSAAAFAHALAGDDGPVVLPACGVPELYTAARSSGRELRYYGLDEHLQPQRRALTEALEPGATVVLTAPFGHPVSADSLALTQAAGATVLEDRSQAPLDARSPAGELAVIGLSPWLGIPDGSLLLGSVPWPLPEWQPVDVDRVGAGLKRLLARTEGRASLPPREPDTDLTARPLSRWSEERLAARDLLPELRATADRRSRELMLALGELCPLTHWPLGSHATTFPVLTEGAHEAEVALRRADILAGRPWVAAVPAGAQLVSRLVEIVAGDPRVAAMALGISAGQPRGSLAA